MDQAEGELRTLIRMAEGKKRYLCADALVRYKHQQVTLRLSPKTSTLPNRVPKTSRALSPSSNPVQAPIQPLATRKPNCLNESNRNTRL